MNLDVLKTTYNRVHFNFDCFIFLKTNSYKFNIIALNLGINITNILLVLLLKKIINRKTFPSHFQAIILLLILFLTKFSDQFQNII